MLYAKALAMSAIACCPRDVVVMDFESGGALYILWEYHLASKLLHMMTTRH